MADHLQQQILEAYQATLIAAATVAGSRVYLDRVDEVPQANLPALLIEGIEESVESVTTDWVAVQQRTYGVSITTVVGQATGAAKAARNLAGQVESALFASLSTSTAAGKAKALRLASSTEEKDGAAAVPTFAVRQSWQIEYFTQSGIQDTSF